jgi:hypothetical protein
MAWSKVKTAAVAGVAVIVLGGAALSTKSVIASHFRAHHLDETSQAEARVKSRQLVDETSGATIIDLKPFINTALTDSPGSPKEVTANNLSELPGGTNLYAGVPFDVEGTIQLMGRKFDDYGKTYPLEVENIPIGRRCAKLHLLHGESTIPWEQSGMSVAKLVLHYASGASEEFNLVAGQQAFDYWGPTWRYGIKGTQTEIKPAPGTELAWFGTNPWVQKWVPQFKLRLYRTTFTNPHPSEVITSCDYVSTMAERTAPFLVGLTVE